METVKKFFKKKTVGFYLSAVAALLSLVTAIVYAAAYNGSNYMSWAAFAMFVLAFVAFVALSLFGVTYRFAPAVGGVLDLIAMCLYIGAVYMYLSEVFYGGITAAAVGRMRAYAIDIGDLAQLSVDRKCVREHLEHRTQGVLLHEQQRMLRLIEM